MRRTGREWRCGNYLRGVDWKSQELQLGMMTVEIGQKEGCTQVTAEDMTFGCDFWKVE